MGASAAKSNPWSVELSSNGEMVQVSPGTAIQVAGDAMEPVARFGQWALLAEEGAHSTMVIWSPPAISMTGVHGASLVQRAPVDHTVDKSESACTESRTNKTIAWYSQDHWHPLQSPWRRET